MAAGDGAAISQAIDGPLEHHLTAGGAGPRPEIDDVLVTPFRLEDLTARVDRLLSQSEGEGPTAVNVTTL